jgi:thiol-disulfide isomerase/thioredoxin
MKKFILFIALFVLAFNVRSTGGYDIRINLKGCNDSVVYLVGYRWDQQFVVDTCKNFKNGQIEFKGNKDLDKGMYILVSQATAVIFEFFVNDSQKFTVNGDISNPTGDLSVTGSKDNELFFTYLKYVGAKNKDFGKVLEQARGNSKEDSTKFVTEKIRNFTAEAKKYDEEYMQKVKGTFVYDFMNLKTEKEPPSVPKASNGRPDSIYSYYYYKNHFFDGIDFKDDRILRTPLFDDRIKSYFDRVILMHPDTMIKEIDKLLAKCDTSTMIYKQLVGYFTYKAEQSKIIGFDKVFVHMGDNYIMSGKAKGVYTPETVQNIKKRLDIMRNLLMDAKVSELYMIDTTMGKVVRKMGFDTASNSQSVTDLYLKNQDKLAPMFKLLSQVNAKYTILVFWASDCGHCQTEIPKLHENLKTIKGKIDFKVFAVQTKDELYDGWKKFIIEKKLTDFIHVFDPVHINNLKERFDIYSTPVIFILDRDKRIKAKRLGADQVVDYINYLEKQEKTPNK